MSTFHICAPRPVERALPRIHCPTCDKRRYFAAFFYEWYGWDHTCLWCGERWQDGERAERPFMRGWRKASVADAERQWRAGRAGEPKEDGSA